MNKNKPSRSKDTHNVVETSIGLAKGIGRETWEDRIKKIKTPFKKWEEFDITQSPHRR
ncbi:MAG: hypothetical protein HQL04_07305 [Nitrospirae bacterium]|nr:hypothetical protein [Nitrospirota bacterium]